MSFSQRAQRLGWHHYFHYELKTRSSTGEDWKSVYKGFSCLGGVPVLELEVVSARYVKLEITKDHSTDPVQLAKLHLFRPLPTSDEPGK